MSPLLPTAGRQLREALEGGTCASCALLLGSRRDLLRLSLGSCLALLGALAAALALLLLLGALGVSEGTLALVTGAAIVGALALATFLLLRLLRTLVAVQTVIQGLQTAVTQHRLFKRDILRALSALEAEREAGPSRGEAF